jgi:glyoxylase-like metal-dependent hydrolase (beta-lactamase superfamily II)
MFCYHWTRLRSALERQCRVRGRAAYDVDRRHGRERGNGYFRQRGIDVYGHASIRRSEDEFRAERADFREAISNPARRARGVEAAFYCGTGLANPNVPITADMALDLGDCIAEILLTPGHTATNVSVFVPSDGVLFCGDCLANEYLPNLDCGSKLDWQQWLVSLERIDKLKPGVILPGHGPPAAGEDAGRLIERVRHEVQRSIAAGRSPTAADAAGSGG